jgi:hypothetical protein
MMHARKTPLLFPQWSHNKLQLHHHEQHISIKIECSVWDAGGIRSTPVQMFFVFILNIGGSHWNQT